MDALALLCNLHGDGPETLRRLRAAGCLDLAQVVELPRAQLDRLLGRGSLAAERFRREGRLLEKRLGGDLAGNDGVLATDVFSRASDAQELSEWADAGWGERAQDRAHGRGGPGQRRVPGSSMSDGQAWGDRRSEDRSGAAAPQRAGERRTDERRSGGTHATGEQTSGGLVHPFPPRKRPAAPGSDEPSAGSVLGAFLDRWREAPEVRAERAPSAASAGNSSASPAASSPARGAAADPAKPGETASAIKQLAEWAERTRSSQSSAQPAGASPGGSFQDHRTWGGAPQPDDSRPRTSEVGEAPLLADTVRERSGSYSDGRADARSRAAVGLPSSARTPRSDEAHAVERAPQPRTSGHASELLDHAAERGSEPLEASPRTVRRAGSSAPPPTAAPVASAREGFAAEAPKAAGTPLGRLPGGERSGPSLEALAFAGLTCLEDLVQAPARQLSDESGLAYTEVLRLQFLAERYLARN